MTGSNGMRNDAEKPVVFVQYNPKQHLGARIAAHSLVVTSAEPDAFDVRLIGPSDRPELFARAGETFLRAGHERVWDPEDLQSFTPLRFAVPDAMGHTGRALVIDPDIFAAGDVLPLLNRDMGDKAVLCRERPGHNGAEGYLATSVMLLDCGKLDDWDFAQQWDDLFAHRLDYVDWIELRTMDRGRIGSLEPVWNDFDRLTPETRLLHTTKRRTQPWKTGLPIDYTLRERNVGPVPAAVVTPILRAWTNRSRYKPHPDPNQEAFVFAMLADMMDSGGLSEAELAEEIEAKHVRPDARELVGRYRGQFWPAVLPGRDDARVAATS